MIITNKQSNERLYLHKDGKEEIFIDTSPLPQHQIDGVRFLFQQFIKKKPGVIISNPVGYGKTLQVALFLNAIHKLLENPVLILCKDDNEVEHWIEIFKTWTKYNEEDIVVESANVFLKKIIFMKKATDIAAYSRRDWGMVVVKNDFAPKDLLKVAIKAKYKIWLTTTDMKKDKAMLNSVYGWLYSQQKFDIDNFVTSNTNCEGTLNKLILFDAFLEDVVITRNDFKTSFRTREVSQEVLNTVSKETKKNKDATGTKIKRSKRKMKDTDVPFSRTELNVDTSSKSNYTISNMDVDTQETIDEFSLNKYSKNDKHELNKTDDKVETDIECFITDKGLIECKEYEFVVDTNTNSMDINGENISFAGAVKDVVNNENIIKLEDNEIYNSERKEDEMKNLHVNDEVDHIDSKIPSNINLNVISGKDLNDENNSVPITIASPNVINNKTNREDNVKKDNNSLSTGSKRQDKEKNVSDIDNKISQMEEMAMKKFKGSLLDSLF